MRNMQEMGMSTLIRTVMMKDMPMITTMIMNIRMKVKAGERGSS